MPKMNKADEIVKNLWLGSVPKGPIERGMFSTVVLGAYECQPPREWFPGATIIRFHLDDSVLRSDQIVDLETAGRIVADAILSGERVLVTCHMGINRSALIVGQALHELGYKNVVGLIRSRRPGTLTNPYFSRYLKRLTESKQHMESSVSV